MKSTIQPQQKMETKNMTTLHLRKSIGPECFRGCLLIAFALSCFALSPALQAVTPAPDGGYPGSNTAEGQDALFSLTSGPWNTALGFQALHGNTTGNSNTAEGYHALFTNNTGSGNTANGGLALFSNTTGGHNTANGVQALYRNTTGASNTADGFQALNANTTGVNNVADGHQALFHNTSNSNVGVGDNAGASIIDGSNDVALGASAGVGIVHASNMIAIGVPSAGPYVDTADTCFIGSIHDEAVSDAGSQQAVFVDQYNVVGVMASSRRFKHDIEPMDKASEAILALKPVTFKYNTDKKGTPQYGLIAEEVAEVNPALVTRDKEGEVTTVRYEQVNAMLLNEFLKEHRTVEDLKSTVAKQEATIAQQQKGMEFLASNLKDQAAQIQKVSAQVEVNKPTPKVVLNNP